MRVCGKLCTHDSSGWSFNHDAELIISVWYFLRRKLFGKISKNCFYLRDLVEFGNQRNYV